MQFFFLFAVSWLIVAFGQAPWISFFGPLAAVLGYALFWKVALSSDRPFLFALLWFAGVQAVQISWMSETAYMGPLIWIVYLGLSVAIGLQFALLTRFIGKLRPLTVPACLALSGAWVIFEWARILPCTGFLWNPAGLALSANVFSIQMASLFGVYGLSFWVIFVNLTGLRALHLRTKKAALLWGLAALLPFAFGAIPRAGESEKSLSALLVQPFLLPDERDLFPGRSDKWVPPLVQWDRILEMIESQKRADLIVFPESAVPFTASAALYPLDLVETLWAKHFGEGASLNDFPKHAKFVQGQWRASNAFWMQAIANHYNSEVIAGMEGEEEGLHYNAAFHFKPKESETARYEKQILVPIAEYMPLQGWGWLSSWIHERYGISSFFEPGTESKLFFGRIPMGISICMEEIHGKIIRESCNRGAELLVNLTNDSWFPGTKLARQHFNHGTIRAVENGVSVLRACCTGVTGAIDCSGRILAQSREDGADALFVNIPLKRAWTPYSLWGESGIFFLSGMFLLGFTFSRLRKNSCSK